MFFVETGLLSVQLQVKGGVPMRLRTITPGAVVGEIGMYLGTPRTATIIAEEPSTVYSLTRENLAKMQEEHPEVAAVVHQYIAYTLSQRLMSTTEVLERTLSINT